MSQRKFLSAEWRKLVMVNYTVDAAILQPYVPEKTELDHYNGIYYISLVGFMFKKVRVKGLAIPFHVNFPEVNLRFYVRHMDPFTKEWKRGVVFISEIVPKPAISFIANTLYNENYSTLPMRHQWENRDNELSISYSWKKRKKWNSLEMITVSQLTPLISGSAEEFITEHFWGYARMRNGKTVEYQVAHPRWDTYNVKSYAIKCNFEELYGRNFGFLQQQTPSSVFLAEGSPITVFSKKVL